MTDYRIERRLLSNPPRIETGHEEQYCWAIIGGHGFSRHLASEHETLDEAEAVLWAMQHETDAPTEREIERSQAMLAAILPPGCDYCGTSEGLRITGREPWGQERPVGYICAECFVGRDDGPCFDDLEEVK